MKLVLVIVLLATLWSSCNVAVRSAISHDIDEKDRQLWDATVAPYLRDDLWTDREAYDAGHFLMVPLHGAFH